MSIDRAAQLKELKLFGMAIAWDELNAEGPRQPMQPEAWLDSTGPKPRYHRRKFSNWLPHPSWTTLIT